MTSSSSLFPPVGFEVWAALQARIDAGESPAAVLADAGVSEAAFDAAARTHATALFEEAERGSRRLYDVFLSVTRAHGQPRAAAEQQSAAQIQEKAAELTQPLGSAASAPSLFDEGSGDDERTIPLVLRERAAAPEISPADATDELSARILPFTPAVIDDPDSLVTLINPPSPELLAQLRSDEEERTIAVPHVAHTGERDIPLVRLASIVRALQRGKPREVVLFREGLTEETLTAVMLVWKERMRQDRSLFDLFTSMIDEGTVV
jgi:hypothetical protein